MAAETKITVPALNSTCDVEMGLLVAANGTATADENTDELRRNEIYLWNKMQNLNVVPTAAEIVANGICMTADATGAGAYSWVANNELSALGEDAPAQNNNRLFALAYWDRDMQPLPDPSTDDVFYKGKTVAPPTKRSPKGKSAQLLAASTATTARNGILPNPHGAWLIYRRVPAATSGKGHRLLNALGNPLKASQIEVYAFRVKWSYTDFTTAAPALHRVTRAVGDMPDLSSGGSPLFNSPLNSLILWNGVWATRRRAVVVSQSKRATKVPKFVDTINLDPTKEIYVHANFDRVKPLIVDGTFGLAVRVHA